MRTRATPEILLTEAGSRGFDSLSPGNSLTLKKEIMVTNKLQNLLDKKCRFRVADFEKAQGVALKNSLRVVFSSFQYNEPTSFIWEATGIVNRSNGDRIRVKWDYNGRAYIGDERMPEFDLSL